MYPECRHVLASGNACDSPALAKSAWCYFHTRLHQRQSPSHAAPPTPRRANRHPNRNSDGRFAALPQPGSHSTAIVATDTVPTDIVPTDTVDYGPYPVGAGPIAHSENASLDLPPVEDTESIQLALIDVIQALAANRIDAKRAGLLLYGLQVASANAAKLNLSVSGVRVVTYTEEGTPLAPQEYGYDSEDYEDEDYEDEDDDAE